MEKEPVMPARANQSTPRTSGCIPYVIAKGRKIVVVRTLGIFIFLLLTVGGIGNPYSLEMASIVSGGGSCTSSSYDSIIQLRILGNSAQGTSENYTLTPAVDVQSLESYTVLWMLY